MPSKYRIRNYQKNSIYHIFNKGLAKGNVFIDEEDYQKFLYYLEIYLAPLSDPKIESLPKRLKDKNLSDEVELIAFLLLPDHFHLILRQKTKNGVSKLLKQLINGYTYYFNSEHKLSGPIFEGKFKSVILNSSEEVINLVRYLHNHPQVSWLSGDIRSYNWSSHKDYGGSKNSIVSTEYVLSVFENIKDFEKFVLDEADMRQKGKDLKTIFMDYA